MGNKFLKYLAGFYEYYLRDENEVITTDEKVLLEEFCDYLQDHYDEEEE